MCHEKTEELIGGKKHLKWVGYIKNYNQPERERVWEEQAMSGTSLIPANSPQDLTVIFIPADVVVIVVVFCFVLGVFLVEKQIVNLNMTCVLHFNFNYLLREL